MGGGGGGGGGGTKFPDAFLFTGTGNSTDASEVLPTCSRRCIVVALPPFTLLLYTPKCCPIINKLWTVTEMNYYYFFNAFNPLEKTNFRQINHLHNN